MQEMSVIKRTAESCPYPEPLLQKLQMLEGCLVPAQIPPYFKLKLLRANTSAGHAKFDYYSS